VLDVDDDDDTGIIVSRDCHGEKSSSLIADAKRV
jgi:hypothetical protein